MYNFYYVCMSTKLIRKQVLLDTDSLKEIYTVLGKNQSNLNLSEFIRSLIQKEITEQKNKGKIKKSRLLAQKGFLESHGNGLESVNHNDIYQV